ncbi:hypothetical protein [Sabulicella glaciei]|uniref:Uncharacterized protein n=1 Tax=Sabulicella glaciei TaxID=2984948 RepID=A0ABT3P2S0_9PROT|nr:hypothetical protein [Roseococcus sp. MDT2-1-1]MCW8088478.1 hypothetical protein [Roseococcus sp. MDT2-1-1]
MARNRSKAAKIDVRVEEDLKQLLLVQAKAEGVELADIVRKYLTTMAHAAQAVQHRVGTPSVPSAHHPASEASASPLDPVLLDQLCQPSDVVRFLHAAEGVIHIAAPWSRSKAVAGVSVEVIHRAWAALDRFRREGESGPHALGLRRAVSSNLAPMLLCFGDMKALRTPGQTRERVETALAEADTLLRAAADEILSVGGATS